MKWSYIWLGIVAVVAVVSIVILGECSQRSKDYFVLQLSFEALLHFYAKTMAAGVVCRWPLFFSFIVGTFLIYRGNLHSFSRALFRSAFLQAI